MSKRAKKLLMPSDDAVDIVVVNPNNWQLGRAIREGRRTRRFVRVELEVEIAGEVMVADARVWLGDPKRSPLSYARVVLRELGAKVASVRDEVTSERAKEGPEWLRARSARQAIAAARNNPCPHSGVAVFWSDGQAYYVQLWNTYHHCSLSNRPLEEGGLAGIEVPLAEIGAAPARWADIIRDVRKGVVHRLLDGRYRVKTVERSVAELAVSGDNWRFHRIQENEDEEGQA